MTVYNGVHPEEQVLAAPGHLPVRLAQKRALLVATRAHQDLVTALARAVAATERTADPYGAMLTLLDDPRDWLVCLVDTGLFEEPADAAAFMRMLCFDHPGVPLLQFNAPDRHGPADLVLPPCPPSELAEAAIALGISWFSPARSGPDDTGATHPFAPARIAGRTA